MLAEGPVKSLPIFLLIFAFGLLTPDSTANHSAGLDAAHEKLVRDFVAAFNARELEPMMTMASDNVQWLSVNSSKLSVEADGKAALRQTMERYFQSCPTCKSTLDWVQTAGSRVTAMEVASWSARTGKRAQRSLSVYEFSEGKILRVYYFPAEIIASQ